MIKELGCFNEAQLFEKIFTLEIFYLMKTGAIRYSADIKNISNYSLSHEDFYLLFFFIFRNYHIFQENITTGLNMKI